MARYYAAHKVVEAQYYPEAAVVELAGYEIPVPAEHYLAQYSGGVLVLPKADFEVLYGDAPFVRSYH